MASRYYRDDHASDLRVLNIIVADAGSTPVTVCGELAGREEMIPGSWRPVSAR